MKGDRFVNSTFSRAGLLCAAALTLAGCAASNDGAAPDAATSSMKLSDVFATPEWAKITGAGDRPLVSRAVSPNDLVNADGSCAAPAEPAAASGTSDSESAEGASAAPSPVAGGIALAMTECDVVQRAGNPTQVEIGAEGETRLVTLTFKTGPWPGIYRFRAGRLTSIEKTQVPEAVKPKRSAPAKPSGRPAQVRIGPSQ